MVASGLYFVTSKTIVPIPYLEFCYYHLLHAKISSGQEAAVRHLVHAGSQAIFWDIIPFEVACFMLWKGMFSNGGFQIKLLYSI